MVRFAELFKNKGGGLTSPPPGPQKVNAIHPPPAIVDSCSVPDGAELLPTMMGYPLRDPVTPPGIPLRGRNNSLRSNSPSKEKTVEEKETPPRIMAVRVEKAVPPLETINQEGKTLTIPPEVSQPVIDGSWRNDLLPTILGCNSPAHKLCAGSNSPSINSMDTERSKPSKNAREVSFAQAMRNPPETEPLIIFPADNPPRSEEVTSSKEISLADIMRKEVDEKFQRANKLYQQFGNVIMKMFEEAHLTQDSSKINYANLLPPLDESVNLIITGNRTLLDMTYQCSVEEYLKLHLINVGIISLYIGHGMGYNKSKLTELGILALLHEIEAGIPMEFPNAGEIEGLSQTSLFVLRKIQYLGETIIPAFKQKSLGSQQNMPVRENTGQGIIDYVKIISLVDTYETLCRPKPYLKKMSPQLVIKQLIESGDDFDKNILKILIKLIGFYPVGSWIELNTGEIARVISINEKSPLRPIVQIVFDKEKHRLQDVKIFDLISNQNIYIKIAISEDEIEGIS